MFRFKFTLAQLVLVLVIGGLLLALVKAHRDLDGREQYWRSQFRGSINLNSHDIYQLTKEMKQVQRDLDDAQERLAWQAGFLSVVWSRDPAEMRERILIQAYKLTHLWEWHELSNFLYLLWVKFYL